MSGSHRNQTDVITATVVLSSSDKELVLKRGLTPHRPWARRQDAIDARNRSRLRRPRSDRQLRSAARTHVAIFSW
jgi:hypothetical protein